MCVCVHLHVRVRASRGATTGKQSWVLAKLGSNNFSESAIFKPTLAALYHSDDTVVAEMAMPSRCGNVYVAPLHYAKTRIFAKAGLGQT